MWMVIKLDGNLNCSKICEKIQTNLFNQFLSKNIPLEGKMLHIEIKDASDTIDPKILKITES